MSPEPFSLNIGARTLPDGRTRFAVWAPDRARVDVELQSKGALCVLPLQRRADGTFEGTHPARAGDRYKLRLDGRDAFCDPAARFLPDGPHGAAEIIDPSSFEWTDGAWPGVSMRGQVFYELHVGAFTREGTFAAAQAQLPKLVELGITCVELMPVNTFPGRFNWGYDGVGLYAPCAAYGRPDDLRALVDRAHRLGLGVILDVVYNHLGPDGNWLGQFSRDYFSQKYAGEWGQPPNFEGPRAARDFFVQNAAYWVSEFHLDGLRVDATHSLFDASPTHVLAEISDAAHAAGGGRRVIVVAENEPQDLRVVQARDQGGHGCDAIWVDDFHHSAHVAVAGEAEAYWQDYAGSAQELISCALRSSLYQGQYYSWQKKARGGPLFRAPAHAAVFFLQNHDQIANALLGRRLHDAAGERRARALTTWLLSLPQTPLLFMGQEYFAPQPWLFFADHRGSLGDAVQRGRQEYLAQFQSGAHAIRQEGYRPEVGRSAFERSRLDLAERERRKGPWALHKALLQLRREDPVLCRQDASAMGGAVLGTQAAALRYFDADHGDRLLVLNLGPTLRLVSCAEPLLAPPPGHRWRTLLCSEEVRFDGSGAAAPNGEGPWVLPAQCAAMLAPEAIGG